MERLASTKRGSGARGRPRPKLENLRLWRLERGIRRKARTLGAEHQTAILPFAPDPISLNMSEVVSLVSCLSTMSTEESSAFGVIAMLTLDVPGKGIYLTKELVQAFRPQYGGFIK
jgi:hypothetical protein